MSHRYGERLSRSQGPPKSSSPSVSGAFSDSQLEDAPIAQAENVTTIGNATNVIADTENHRIDAPKSTLPFPSPDELDSWTLNQLRAQMEEVVVQKRIASGQARKDLENRRLSLIERITRMERAEKKKKDGARRGEISFLKNSLIQNSNTIDNFCLTVVIGRDVAPPPPDPIEKPWRKKRFGPNTRRSGPVEPPRKVKEDEEEEDNPDEELRSKRWKLKVGSCWRWVANADFGIEETCSVGSS
jgi:hypothetical protein